MEFLDEVVIRIRSGDGGRGCVSFKRERFRPKGGPDGGNGGDGGNVILRVSAKRETLSHFGSKRYFRAENGRPGKGNCRTGKNGKDCIIEVPPGTQVYDAEQEILLGDLTIPGQELMVLKGGKGGKGNAFFATSTNRAPRYAQSGIPGQEKRLRLSLKYIADVGIIGLPNAGKSTLLSRITKARPKIDAYPFTTLVPELGILDYENGNTLTIADIPGLIKDASKGKGLGLTFLKHVERTKLLLHMIDISNVLPDDLLRNYMILRDELVAYSPHLNKKDHMVVINKIDLVKSDHQIIEEIRKALKDIGVESIAISALNGQGLNQLKAALYRKFFNSEGD